MKKILFLTRYDTMGASSRYRFFQFFQGYQKAGYSCVAEPFFDDSFLEFKYKNNKNSIIKVLRAFLRRFLVLFTSYKYDFIIIEKEIFPYFPAWPELILKVLGKKVLVDYDDALFHQYANHSSGLVRFFLGGKIAKVMKYAKWVVAGNEYLANYAINAGATHVTVVPTVIDLSKYPKVYKKNSHLNPIIGWIGSPSTVKYLHDLLPVFEELNKKIPITLHIVGADITFPTSFKVVSIPWSDSTEVVSMLHFDIGVMPLPDSPWERGKCGFKLIQYMGCSKAVVASPVGVNSYIVSNELDGFLAKTEEQWYHSLKLLLSDVTLRDRMGSLGRIKVEQKYNVDVALSSLLDIIVKVDRII